MERGHYSTVDPCTFPTFAVHAWCAVHHVVARYRPAIIPARLDNIQFISSLITVFSRPQCACCSISEEPLRAAMSVCPQLGECPDLSDKWIIERHAPINVQPDHFTRMPR